MIGRRSRSTPAPSTSFATDGTPASRCAAPTCPTTACRSWRAFFETRYLEVGWGEKHYYPNPEPGVWTFLRAGAWPTGSVVHAVPVSGRVPDAFPQQTVIRLRIPADALDRLAAYVRASLRVAPGDSAAPAGRALPAAPGYYPDSRFFESGLSYHVFQNCNHWAAEALEAAGCKTARWRAITVGRVLKQAERCGERVQSTTPD